MEKEKIHLEMFAVNLCAYFAEVVSSYVVVKKRFRISILSSRFYQFDTCLDSDLSKYVPVSEWQMFLFSKRDII